MFAGWAVAGSQVNSGLGSEPQKDERVGAEQGVHHFHHFLSDEGDYMDLYVVKMEHGAIELILPNLCREMT